MIVLLKNLEPGMICSRDILHKTGMVIIPADTVLKEKHIEILKKWGIESVQVGEQLKEVELSEVELNVAKAKVAPRFLKPVNNEVMKKIEEIAIKWRASEDRVNNEQ